MTTGDIAVVGLESRFIYDLLDILARAGLDVAACVRSRYDSGICGELPSVRESFAGLAEGTPFVTPLLTPGRRKRAAEEARAAGLADAAAVIDPTAVVSPRSRLAAGTVVGPAAVVGANCTVGLHGAINRAASMGHDCVIEDYCSIGPGTTLCGACHLEPGVFLGAGVVLAPKVRIGRNAVVGAGSVVVRDVPAHAVVAGNPARLVRDGVAGYRDIGV